MTNIADQLRTEDRITNSMLDKVEVHLHDGVCMDHLIIGGVKLNCHEMSRLCMLLQELVYGSSNPFSENLDRVRGV